MEKKKESTTKKKTITKKTNNKKTIKKTTTRKNTKKKSKAFTLIELLAVIIILGILMIIAIPSVTTYISDSRKSAYIDTAKNIVGGARNLVNEGKLGMYNTDTTYYLPAKMIKTETGDLKSPYGEFTEAYVAVTFDGKGYDYYWTSTDTTEQGIYLTSVDKLDNDRVVAGVKEINTDVAICNKEKIVIFNSDGTIKEQKEADDCIDKNFYYEVEPNREITGTLIGNDDDVFTTFGYRVARHGLESITFLNHINVPDNAIASWDASVEQNGSIMAWYTNENNNLYYELYVGQEGGVIAPKDCSYLFDFTVEVSKIDLTYFDTRYVENMDKMFYRAGRDNPDFKIIGLSNLNTKNVKSMSRMFYEASEKANFDYDISKWNVSKVEDMSLMFYYTGVYSSTFRLGDIGRWNVSNVKTFYSFFASAGRNATTWTIGDLSRWNISNATNLYGMFSDAGSTATSWNIGDLSNWNVSNATNIAFMFYHSGLSSNSFNLGNLGRWDVSKVEDMSSLFNTAGKNATNWYVGDLTNWDVSKVTKMGFLFYYAGYNANSWSVGNLSNWDVSNVTDMSGMFAYSGYKAENWNIGELTNWDTTKVTNMYRMFFATGNLAGNWNSIGSLKIYASDIRSMFSQCTQPKVTLKLYSNPSSYSQVFLNSATKEGSYIIIDYSSNVTVVNALLRTIIYTSNVTIGNKI